VAGWQDVEALSLRHWMLVGWTVGVPLTVLVSQTLKETERILTS
jgi:hypothetical protein